jgi:hypothetical protein
MNSCLCCNQPTSNPKYCSHSCCARKTNVSRGPRSAASRTKISETMLAKHSNIFSQPYKKAFPYCYVYFSTCKNCDSPFTKHNHNIHLCRDCKMQLMPQYRVECAFKLNKYEHPELFDGAIIQQYGWFVSSGAKKNRKGVCWDHLFPIHMGFANKIPPEILRHPANAELVPYTENIRRFHEQKFTITYDELLKRIKLWDSGFRNLKRYYV